MIFANFRIYVKVGYGAPCYHENNGEDYYYPRLRPAGDFYQTVSEQNGDKLQNDRKNED